MYFGTKFTKSTTKLLLLQEPKGGKVRLAVRGDGFWKFEQCVHFNNPVKYLTVQPLLMFNTIVSTNSRDLPIQDHDVLLDSSAEVNNMHIDQEILCWDSPDTVITCYMDESKKTMDDYYSCKSDLKMTGDVVDIEVGEEDVIE